MLHGVSESDTLPQTDGRLSFFYSVKNAERTGSSDISSQCGRWGERKGTTK